MSSIEVVELPPVACPGPGCDRDLLADNMNSTDYLTDCIETPDAGVARFVCGKCGTCSEWKFTESPLAAVYLRTMLIRLTPKEARDPAARSLR